MHSFLSTSLDQAVSGGGGNRTRDAGVHKPLEQADSMVAWFFECVHARERALFAEPLTTIYFVAQADGPVKIGRTKQPVAERVRILQTGNPAELSLLGFAPGTALIERLLHKVLLRSHLRGEWFKADGSVLAMAGEFDALRHRCRLTFGGTVVATNWVRLAYLERACELNAGLSMPDPEWDNWEPDDEDAA